MVTDAYTTVSKWASYWKDTIVTYGMVGMDIVNHSDDWVNSHM